MKIVYVRGGTLPLRIPDAWSTFTFNGTRYRRRYDGWFDRA